jgi:hypothetical protein
VKTWEFNKRSEFIKEIKPTPCKHILEEAEEKVSKYDLWKGNLRIAHVSMLQVDE